MKRERLTPAAGCATQNLPGSGVIEGVLPAGRVLLAGWFVLGARHGDSPKISSVLINPGLALCLFQKRNAPSFYLRWGTDNDEKRSGGNAMDAKEKPASARINGGGKKWAA